MVVVNFFLLQAAAASAAAAATLAKDRLKPILRFYLFIEFFFNLIFLLTLPHILDFVVKKEFFFSEDFEI